MKLALITPPGSDWMLEMNKLGYHFVLSQYVTDPAYQITYRRMHGRGHFIMIDNGAAELDRYIDPLNLKYAAEAIGADEIIMPDVLRDKDATLAATSDTLHLFPRHKRAMAPQGATWFEWEACAKEMVKMGCRTLCVPKLYEGYEGGRAHALRLIELNQWHWDHDIHLLGCYRHPLKEMFEAAISFPWVRGIDTAAPIAYAQVGKSVGYDRRQSLKWGEPVDPKLAQANLEKCLRACNGEPPDAYNDN